MKLFIAKTILFGFLLILLLQLIKKSVPYYWGNPIMGQKIKDIFNSEEDYNTFFVGSSHTYRQIDPVLFNEKTGLKSYNLAYGGMFYLETHYFLENFLKSFPENKNINIFFQYMKPSAISDRNLHTVRSKYYMDFKRLKMGLSYYWEEKNYHQIRNHLIAFIENILAIDELKDIIKYHTSDRKELSAVLRNQLGYYALDQQLELENQRWMIRRRNKYLEQREKDKTNNIVPNKSTIEKLKILQLNKMETNFITNNDYIHFYKIGFVRLDTSLYFDMAHFNSSGAEVFTRNIAEYFNKTIYD